MPRRRARDPWYPPYPPAAKPRPVEGGIRARSRRGAIGETWWSQRFIELLESFGLGLGGRLDRGKRYARQGQVVSMDIDPGGVTARVQGSRARPYRVWIGVAQLSEEDWRHAEQAMAERARFLAMLLAGEMPHDIEEAFAACSLSVFPTSLEDLETDCSCPDWANPCKHLAAVYYLLAEAFDEDPFLLLHWRGRDRDTLLANLRALRGVAAEPADSNDEVDPWAEIEAIPPPQPGHDLGGFWRPATPLAEVLHLETREPAMPDAILHQLDDLDLEISGQPVVECLRPAYPVLTAAARRRLLGEIPTA